jgi:outer membrane immunogenic protein
LVDGSHDADGGLGGVQGGCLYQTGNCVFGIQGDGGWTSVSGSSLDQASLINQFDRSRVDSLYSVTGRVGYAVNTAMST